MSRPERACRASLARDDREHGANGVVPCDEARFSSAGARGSPLADAAVHERLRRATTESEDARGASAGSGTRRQLLSGVAGRQREQSIARVARLLRAPRAERGDERATAARRERFELKREAERTTRGLRRVLSGQAVAEPRAALRAPPPQSPTTRGARGRGQSCRHLDACGSPRARGRAAGAPLGRFPTTSTSPIVVGNLNGRRTENASSKPGEGCAASLPVVANGIPPRKESTMKPNDAQRAPHAHAASPRTRSCWSSRYAYPKLDPRMLPD